MSSRLARRVLLSLGSIIGASIWAFILLRLAPGNPARQVLGQFATPEQINAFNTQNDINKPFVTQYVVFVRNFFTGRWGFSYASGAPVTTLIRHRLPASIELGVLAFVFALVVAVILGLLATYRRRPIIDWLTSGFAFFGLGAAPFWLGLVLVLIFSEKLHVFPGISGQVNPNLTVVPAHTGFLLIDSLIAGNLSVFGSAIVHLILPVVTLGLGVCGYLLRILRASLLEVSQEPYLKVVESKGVARWTAFRRHALHNAVLPTLTASGLVLGQLLGGSVLVEGVFNWPGVGQLIVLSISQKDFSIVDVFVMLSATGFVVVNFVIDLLYSVVDPRLGLGGVT